MEQGTNSYISFMLGEEYFAINVGKVLNILQLVQITKVPTAPDYMKGVINLRGTVLPIIDVRMKFGMEPIEYKRDTVILVLNVEIEGEVVNAGILVDSVKEVFELQQEEIMPPPGIGAKYKSKFIDGVYRMSDEKFVMLLDIDKVFSTDELVMMQDTAESEESKKAEKIE
ncbi:MAG: chemotaxis protein CheW [Bacteroidales bacterium]|jgi:purine-binding chemotaxis protein CheW|nr:chemotaxis protein CheW [Bacteroidales bacterium]MBQ5403204.1 chemotaxis protein CheW [Bacteroidales bacterium]MBR6278400.1 chemotaxis protein CheW [Bacteroidales bacterium]